MLACRTKLLGIDRGCHIAHVRPQFLVAQRLRRRGRSRKVFATCFLGTVDRYGYDVLADRETISVTELVRRSHALLGAVQEGAVGGNIMEPIAAVAIPNFTVLAGDVAGRIRQRPIEMRASPDVDAALAADMIADGAAIRQGCFVD